MSKNIQKADGDINEIETKNKNKNQKDEVNEVGK